MISSLGKIKFALLGILLLFSAFCIPSPLSASDPTKNEGRVLLAIMHEPSNSLHSTLAGLYANSMSDKYSTDVDTIYVMKSPRRENMLLELRHKFYNELCNRSYSLIVVSASIADGMFELLDDMHINNIPVLIVSIYPLSKERLEKYAELRTRQPLTVLSSEETFPHNLSLALTLYPKNQTVVCLRPEEDAIPKDELDKYLPSGTHVNWIPVDSNRVNVAKLSEKLSRISGEFVVVSTREVRNDSSNAVIPFRSLLEQLKRDGGLQEGRFFSSLQADFFKGGLGGYSMDLEHYASEMADFSIKTLKSPQAFQLVRSDCFINYRLFTSMRLKPERLPDRVTWLNRPPTFWETNRIVILVSGAIMLVLTMIIGLLSWMRFRLLRLNGKLVKARNFAEEMRQTAQNEMNRFRQTIESMADGVIVVDVEQIITMVNPRAAELLDVPADSLIGHPLTEKYVLKKPDTDKPIEPPTLTVMRESRIVELSNHVELVRSNAKTMHVANSAAPVFDSMHRILGCVLIFRDVTKEYEQRDQLKKALDASRAAERAKSYFLSSVSHELRTPLNSILGFTELLQDTDVDSGEAKEYLQSIAYSGKALFQLINDVLDLSKLEAGQMKVVPVECDFPQLGKDALKMFAPQERALPVKLLCEIETMPKLLLDLQRVRQILINLLGNAAKFTTQGSILLRGSFTPAPEPPGQGTLRFSVTDTGKGIAYEDQSKIMEPFVQLTQMRGTAAENKGTGLGLSISKRMAEAMDGTLTLESKPGVGSTFYVELRHVAVADGSGPETEAEPVANLPAAGTRHAILLVDDIKMNLSVMKAICRKCGIDDIAVASSGTDALNELQNSSFDLILTDMWMPGMDGAELARRIRSDKRFKSMTLIAVTADADVRNNFETSYFDDIILKPVSKEKIERVLERLNHADARKKEISEAEKNEGK